MKTGAAGEANGFVFVTSGTFNAVRRMSNDLVPIGVAMVNIHWAFMGLGLKFVKMGICYDMGDRLGWRGYCLLLGRLIQKIRRPKTDDVILSNCS